MLHALAKMEKIMAFIDAINIVASRPTERRLTGMPTAHAKNSTLAQVRFNLELKNWI